MSTNRGMDKDIVYTCNGIILSQKVNRFDSFVVRWVNLEPVIKSEVSQKEKNKARIISLSCEV